MAKIYKKKYEYDNESLISYVPHRIAFCQAVLYNEFVNFHILPLCNASFCTDFPNKLLYFAKEI